jgi:hypothetical protein
MDISTNYIFNKIFVVLIRMNEPAKKLSSQIYESNHKQIREVINPLRLWDDER